MIRFACLCKHRIEVDADMAGGLTQCTRCGRLNDVPTLSDLPALGEDGTYNVDVKRPKDDPLRLAELSIVYAKGSKDAQGDVIDLRISAGELAAADSAEAPEDNPDGIPLKDEPARQPLGAPAYRPAPRYNPETGELIEQFDLKPDANLVEHPGAIPMAKASIGYATGAAARRVTARRVAVEMLMPVNVTVMAFVFLAHIAFQITGMVTVNGLWIFGIVPLLLAWAIVSHYGNVIDEIACQDRDELPRPLRGCALGEDIWQPLVNVLCGLSICFVPPVFIAMRLRAEGMAPAPTLLALGAMFIIAIFFLPGVLLTTNTSGTIVNLRPDRLLGLVKTCGAGYGIAVGLGALATATYGFGIVAADMAFIRVLTGMTSPLPVWVHLVGYPMLALGIYCAHFFCWHLGLMYREHHAQFPWAYQRHVPDPNVVLRRGIIGRAVTRPKPPRPDTKAKLRELRDLERKRRAEEMKRQPADAPLD